MDWWGETNICNVVDWRHIGWKSTNVFVINALVKLCIASITTVSILCQVVRLAQPLRI